MKVKSLIINFVCDDLVKGKAEKLRGFFANKYSEYTLMHHHLGENRYLYKLPIIQYKILDGKPMVLGIEKGVHILQRIYKEINHVRFGNFEYQINEKNIILKTDYFGLVNSEVCYTFLTPWLALNEKNYEEYQKYGTWIRRKELLERIVVANIISLSKGIGYTVEGNIRAKIERLKEAPVILKGTPFLGFLGEFSVNFAIPDYWGIGKSVSRGFGTIKKKGA